ncbi:MAG: ThiF family adenylyltransferase [Deltaproteobacteria bacterium]
MCAVSQLLSQNEIERFSRHLLIPEVGLAGQKKLKGSRVLLVGLGGLGSPAAYYLAASGIGTLGIVENDRIEAANLHRQILYSVSDIGKLKVDAAREKLSRMNEFMEIKIGIPLFVWLGV